MAAISKRHIVPGQYRIPKMRPEFNPETAGQPVSTYKLDISSPPIQIAFSDNGLIAITDFEGTIHLYDKQYHSLHTFTCCDDEMDHDDFEHNSMPTQMVFDAHGNIHLAVLLYRAKEQGGLLRFNTNGKRLPEMSVPEVVQGRLAEEHGSNFNVTGVTRDPHGNVFFRLIHVLSDGSVTHVYICKQTKGSGVPTVLSDDVFGQDDDDDDDVEDVRQYVNQLAYGPNDHLYVVSPDGIQEIDSANGDKLQTISLDALPVGDDVVPKACFSLTVSGDGYIFVVVLGTRDVYVFSQDGSYLSKLSTPSSDSVGATAIDRDGFLHVLDPTDGCVYIF